MGSMIELWENINGMPDYQVSNLGRIRRYRYEKWRYLKPEKTYKGYLRVAIPESEETRPKCRKQYIHLIVATHFKPIGVTKDSTVTLQIDHIDGDKSNNRASNLDWVTGSENMLRHNARIKAIIKT